MNLNNINIELILEIALPILTILFGALTAYFNQNNKLKDSALKYITEAEEMYKDSTKAGGLKFTWVVETLYNLVPGPLKFIITKSCIEKLVQNTFDEIEAYAKMQLEKAVDEMLAKIEEQSEIANTPETKAGGEVD